MAFSLRYLGHRCVPGGAIVPWYQHGRVDLVPGCEVTVPPHGLVLGRGASADVRVASNGVARAHVRLTIVEGKLHAEDLSSTNGTQRNGVTAASMDLASGDVLSLADAFDFLVVESR
jgi:hypothetical protein